MNQAEQILQRILDGSQPLFARELEEAQSNLLKTKAIERLAVLAPNAPAFRQSINRMLFLIGPPVLALYRTLRDDVGLQQEPALRLLTEMLDVTYRRFVTSLLGRVAINVAMQPALRIKPLGEYFQNKYLANEEPQGFRFKKPSDEAALMAFDVSECALLTYAKAQGAPEIVPLICALDHLIAEPLVGATLKRKGTLATGAHHCDFRYVKRTEPQDSD